MHGCQYERMKKDKLKKIQILHLIVPKSSYIALICTQICILRHEANTTTIRSATITLNWSYLQYTTYTIYA
jgi:hypothetical protein